jgi:hypothetical protein
MGLFKKMKDPVRGSAKVTSASVLSGLSSSHLQLVITADGVPPTPVEVKTTRHGDRWPNEGDTIPVTVDRANPQSFNIEWSAVQKVSDRMRQREERATEGALAKARRETPSTSREKPERTARTKQSDQPSGATTKGDQLVGTVTHYFGQPHVAIVEITAGELRVGDTIRVVGRTSEFEQKIESMQLDHAPVDSAKVGDDVGIEMAERTREHDHVYLVRRD